MYLIIKKYLIKSIPIICIYFFWILMHYIASHLYTMYCTEYSVIGFLISPLLISSIHCYSLRWIIIQSSDIINNMWILLSAWLASLFFPN
jgi:hypothetical protein